MTISSDPRQWQIGMLGYGEVGRILAEDLRKQNIKVATYDIKLDRGQGAAFHDAHRVSEIRAGSEFGERRTCGGARRTPAAGGRRSGRRVAT